MVTKCVEVTDSPVLPLAATRLSTILLSVLYEKLGLETTSAKPQTCTAPASQSETEGAEAEEGQKQKRQSTRR